MDEKTQSTNPENTDIVVPLPIDNEETEEEGIATPKKEPIDTQNTLYIAPPPLPIKEDNETPTIDHKITVKPPIKPETNKYSPRSPPKFVAAHLRPPPPLTPMSSIDNQGSVIMNDLPPAVNGYNSCYLPPPPPPQTKYEHMEYHPYPAATPPPFAIEYKCKPCSLVFNTKQQLLGHKRDVHPDTSMNVNNRMVQHDMIGRRARFYCNICGRSFSAKQHFEYHMRTHSGEKPFKCPTCNKAFRAKHSLKNHLRIHTGERPYQCKVCGKWFRQLGVMKNIKNMHSR